MTITPELSAPPGTEPAERGRLDISSTVVRKIVEHVADTAPGTLRAQRKVAGLELGSSGSSAKVAVAADVVDIRLELALRYPGSIPDQVAQVRTRVTDEVLRLTGHQVRVFDVTVSGLRPEPVARLR
jgi:uncharacterized alkaline shock family protein YloU